MLMPISEFAYQLTVQGMEYLREPDSVSVHTQTRCELKAVLSFKVSDKNMGVTVNDG